ncbi:MAG TPA: NADH-quinone oxidoreductase subunit M [Bryobacteraceae bacterium]
MSVLAATCLIPFVGFLIILCLPRKSNAAFYTAFGASLVAFFVSLALIPPALANGALFTSVTNQIWLDNPALPIRFHMGVDGISLWLILLTTFLLPIAVWAARSMIKERLRTFLAFLLLFEFGVLCVFSALDLFMFYVFWEIALVPMYLMVGTFGGPKRGPTALKFFVYTMLGSVLMLASILYLHSVTGTFDYVEMMQGFTSGRLMLTGTQQTLLFLGFFAAFAIKTPIFPLHTWLPDTYTQAPMPATMLLAAVMSKMGVYGLLRFSITLFPNAAQDAAHWVAILAIIGILYAALLAFIQPNIKRLIAYSSLSHLSFIVLGIFTLTQQGADGAVFLMIAHGVSIAALFLLTGYMEQRRGSLEIADFGGLASPAPGLASAYMITLYASIGLPTLCNFIGEFLILQGAAIVNFAWAGWATGGVILSAVYMLWMYQRTFWRPKTEQVAKLPDLRLRDWVPVVPLILLMLWLGNYTQSFMPPISSATSRELQQNKASQEYRVQLKHPRTVHVAEVLRAH